MQLSLFSTITLWLAVTAIAAPITEHGKTTQLCKFVCDEAAASTNSATEDGETTQLCTLPH